jgi:ABC-type phosphate transport system substrate-binding protein
MRAFFIHLLALLCIIDSASLAYGNTNNEAPPIAVVVSSNPEFSPINQLAIHELSLIYWRKKQYWQNGVRIRPANLHAEHPLRLYFSKVVLGSEPIEQNDYWNGLYFHGTTPPYSVQSEEAILRYVASTKGAIGYVDACKVDERVKTVLWIAKDKIFTNIPENLNCKSTAE